MPEASVTQKTNIGHNIVADKGATVSVGHLSITSLSSADLVTFAKQFLKYITYRDWTRAKAYLDSLKSVNSLDDECKSLLTLLEYKLGLFHGQGLDESFDQDLFFDLLRSSHSNNVIKDVVESIYIHHLALVSANTAKQRFIESSVKGRFTEEVFFELLANIDELEQRLALSDTLSSLYESEFSSFILCALRCGNFPLAVELAEKLAVVSLNINSEVLVSLSRACLVHSKIEGRHYWLISYDLMEDLGSQVELCLGLSKKTDDKRVIRAAAILLASSSFEFIELLDICRDELDEAEKVIPHIRKVVESIGEHSEKLGSAKKLLNKENLILNESEFSLVAKDFFDGKVSERVVRSWLQKGGVASVDDEVLNSFMSITLHSIVCKREDRKKKLELSEELDRFLSFPQEKIRQYNVHAIFQLCINLQRLELPQYIVQLLESFLSKSPWASPVLELYAESLSASDQMGTLDSLLENIEGDTNTFRLLAIKIERECIAENYVEALELTETALSKYPDHCHYWWCLLHVLGLSGAPVSEIDLVVSRIPKELFEEYDDEAFKLLRLVADTDLDYAESIILEWFIDNPAGMAINVTNLHFGSITSSGQRPSSNSYVSDRCSQAVVYTAGNRQYTKLLVEGCEPNQYLIDIEDPLGELLSSLEVGEEQKYDMETYKLLEKLPAIVGAFRISINIRTELNVGNDCFYQMTFNESDGVEGLLKLLESIPSQPHLMEPQIDGRPIPLLLKLNHTHRNDLVRGALLYLHDRDSNNCYNLFAQGETVKESIVLDVLSLVYLSLTGLYLGLVNTEIKLFVTRETHQIVLDWLTLMGRPEHLSIAKTDEGFIKTTAEHISKDTNINNLRTLIEACEIIVPTNIDMPDVFMKIRDTVDTSHYSSLKASLSHSVPLFCLDSELCSLYQQLNLNVKVVNANQFLIDIKSSDTAEIYRLAQSLVYLNLPVPLEYDDVIALCLGKDNEQHIAAQLLKKYPNNYPSPEMALRVLKSCCLQSICTAYLSFIRHPSPFAWRYTEHIFYASCESAMKSINGDDSTQRLALFMFKVLNDLEPISDTKVNLLANELFRRFIRGHFLDARKIDLALQGLRNDPANN